MSLLRINRTANRSASPTAGRKGDALPARLDGLRGLPVTGIVVGAAGTVALELPGWTITLADVADCARLGALKIPGPGYLAGAGRYGRFWWVSLEGGTPDGSGTRFVLGTHLHLTPVDGPSGARDEDRPHLFAGA